MSNSLPFRISGWINSGGVHQHNRDVVLNGVDTMAFATLQASTVGIQHHRLLANRANQDFQQIRRNHRDIIVIPDDAIPHDPMREFKGNFLTTAALRLRSRQAPGITGEYDAIESPFD